MATDEEIHQALLVINSRLQTIDGKVNLLARANRDPLLDDLKKLIRAKPIIGQIYLLLDGSLNQEEVTQELRKSGVSTSKSAVSRWLVEMSGEHGIAERVPVKGPGKTYRKNLEMEHALNLSKKIEKWLADLAKEERPTRSRKKS